VAPFDRWLYLAPFLADLWPWNLGHIFALEKYLDTWVMGSLEMTPFDRLHRSCYSHSIYSNFGTSLHRFAITTPCDTCRSIARFIYCMNWGCSLYRVVGAEWLSTVMAGVKVGCVCLCRVASNIVRWLSHEELLWLLYNMASILLDDTTQEMAVSPLCCTF